MGKVRIIQANDLSKEQAHILDRIVLSGESFVVLRYSRPVAMMIPVPDDIKKSLVPDEDAPGAVYDGPADRGGAG